MTFFKHSLKRNSHWSTYYFTSEKGTWNLTPKNSVSYLEYPQTKTKNPILNKYKKLIIERHLNYNPPESQKTATNKRQQNDNIVIHQYKKDII